MTSRDSAATDAGPVAQAAQAAPKMFPPPASRDFDLATADAATLRYLGVTARPDEDPSSRLRQLWTETFGRTLRFVARASPDEPAYEFARGPAAEATPTRVPPLKALAGHLDTSQNWSGAYLTASGGKSFVQVWGQWVAPAVRPPAGASPPSSGTIDYQCSIWIGLDGQRRYRNSSLPQIGTAHAVTVAADGTQTHQSYAWTQWWNKNGTNLPVTIENFPVRQGDVISCVLTVLDDRHVLLNIVNQSTEPPAFAAVELESPIVRIRNGREFHLSVTGATAEWVMERPMVPELKKFYAFPDYGSVNFLRCHAVQALPGGGGRTDGSLQSPRSIRMYEVRSDPQRTAFISMPYRIDETSFNVTHGGFKD